MNKDTEALLDKLSKDFVEGKHPKTRKVGKPPKIDHAKFIEARGKGMNMANAVKEAGSTAKSPKTLQVIGSQLIAEHPEYQVAIVDIMRDKQRMLLDAMTQTKADDASLSSIAVALGIVTDKLNVAEGKPTARVETVQNLDEMDKQRLLGFVIGRLSAGKTLKG